MSLVKKAKMRPGNSHSKGIHHDDEIRGTVRYHYEFYSRFLKNERDIIVWLPYSYKNDSRKYPVLYMQDGQNLFNPRTAFLGYDWKVDETMAALIELKKIQEVIVVGIYNSRDRMDEYNWFSDKGKSYASFIIRELKPFIDDHYHTYPDSKNTAIMGSSLGGLISFQLAWNYPGIFGKAGCLSNSFWVDECEVFRMIKYDPVKLKDIRLYLDCGTEERQLINDNTKMYRYLKKIGYTTGENLYWHVEEGGKHTEYDWARRLHLPLKFLFGR